MSNESKRQKLVTLVDEGRTITLKKWSNRKFFAITESMTDLGSKVAGMLFDPGLSADGKPTLLFKGKSAELAKALVSSGREAGAWLTKVLLLSVDPSEEKTVTEDFLADLTVDDTVRLLADVVDLNFTEDLSKNLQRLQGGFRAKVWDRLVGAGGKQH